MSQSSTTSSNSEIEQLKERIASLEEKLLRVSNIYRYENLQNLLKKGKWLEADKETVRLILSIAGESEMENLRPNEIEHLDCSELQVIDRLWNTYSDGRFGFGIQAKIYQDLGGNQQTTIEQDAKLTAKWGDLRSIAEGIAWGGATMEVGSNVATSTTRKTQPKEGFLVFGGILLMARK